MYREDHVEAEGSAVAMAGAGEEASNLRGKTLTSFTLLQEMRDNLEV